MSVGDIIMVKISEIVASGDGLARFGSKAIFATRSCVGENIEVCIFEEQPTWARAEFRKLVGKPSPDRVKPQCKYFGKCGGCTMQHIRYEAQLEAKVARFRDKFTHIAGFRPPEMRVVASTPWEFRNYLRFSVKRDTDGGATLGFPDFRGGETVPVFDCPIARPEIRALLRDTVRDRFIPLPDATEYVVYARDGLLLCDTGKRVGSVKILDKEIVIDVNSHIPDNISVTERLIADLIDIADSADRSRPMVDLFCGIGTFSSFLAASFPGADLIDRNRSALALAKINVNVSQARFHELNESKWIEELNPPPGHYGFMVVDPPTLRHLSSATRDWLTRGGPPIIAYASQDTHLFAEDAKELSNAGYRLTRITMYDFWPHTGWTNTLAVFERH